jgi:hypothetical protein
MTGWFVALFIYVLAMPVAYGAFSLANSSKETWVQSTAAAKFFACMLWPVLSISLLWPYPKKMKGYRYDE